MNTAPLSNNSWQYRELNSQTPSLNALSDALIELVERGEPVVAGTADLQYSNGLSKFAELHPERFVQFGISEQNMVSAAAGMAAVGMKPFVATFASFLPLLCCEQIRMDVAYSALPVRLIGHHAGISLGFYGTSHHATEDLAIMRSIADITVVAPADGNQLKAAILASANYPQPIYFRIQRGRDPVVYDSVPDFVFGKATVHLTGDELTIIATGSTVHPALEAARALNAAGRSVGVIDMTTIKRAGWRRVRSHRRGGHRRQGAPPWSLRRVQPDCTADSPLPTLPAGCDGDRKRGAGGAGLSPHPDRLPLFWLYQPGVRQGSS
jgi:transketolase